MLQYLDIQTTAFTLWGYPISFIELTGTIFGLLSVYYAAKADILTWPTAIINEIAFFGLFFQVQLYADMFLQVYFFIATCYGWYYWKRGEVATTIYVMSLRQRGIYALVLLFGTLLLGQLVANIHLLWPKVFPLPASYPFADAFTTVASVMAMILLSRKRIENWILWMAVDVVAVILYFLKDIRLIAIEYIVFFMLCVFGFIHWKQQYESTRTG
ncbi:MAG: nicotinamide riboside transporter PnuC [Saprospiraceae bacterium]